MFIPALRDAFFQVHFILSEPAQYFCMYFRSRIYDSKFPSFGIHSQLQNSNSTFSLIYAYDCRNSI